VNGNVHHDFDLRTGTVRFRLLESDGTTPVTQRQVAFLFADGGDECGRGTTNDNGWIELPPMPSVRLVPRVQNLPQDVTNPAPLSAQSPAQTVVELNGFTVNEGSTSEVVRKLPAK
jgi:hypothetical protein